MTRNEVCDVLDVSQFVPGRSAYECVAYAAALLKYAGKPGHGPIGSTIQASNLAQFYYGKLEGGNDAANKNGMSVATMETMLNDMGLHWTAEQIQYDNAHDTALIRLILKEGNPCIVCGAESSFFDVGLGSHIPYSWTPTGNHAIVVSGIAPDGNFLVHDTANVDAQGHIRPGPRTYEAERMQLVSVTAVQIMEEDMIVQPLAITQPEVAALFEDVTTDAAHPQWKSKATGRVMHDALLKAYIAGGMASLDYLGDILSPEYDLPNGTAIQIYKSGARVWTKATGKVGPFDLFGSDGQAMLRKLLNVPAPAPEVPQEHAIIEQIKALVQSIP